MRVIKHHASKHRRLPHPLPEVGFFLDRGYDLRQRLLNHLIDLIIIGLNQTVAEEIERGSEVLGGERAREESDVVVVVGGGGSTQRRHSTVEPTIAGSYVTANKKVNESSSGERF